MKKNEYVGPYKPGNPFYGRDPEEVWKEILAKVIPADREVAMKQIEDIIKERKAKK